MPLTSPSYTVTMRVRVLHPRATQHLVGAVADAGALVTGIDMVESLEDYLIVLVTCDCINTPHVNEVNHRIEMMVGMKVLEISDATSEAHEGGKISVERKNPLRTRQDLARVYTPGVARVCKKIARDKSFARSYTIKKNTVAVVTDGTAVLGLGDIGPEAALPVMEGKAALFKKFGGVCLAGVPRHQGHRGDHLHRQGDCSCVRWHQSRGHPLRVVSRLRNVCARNWISRSSTMINMAPRS